MPYIIVLLLFFLSALYLEWKFRIHLYKTQRERVVISILFFLVGVIWDTYAVASKQWIFPGKGLIGWKIGLLPLEEYLFFLIVPFWILTIYKILDKKFR